MKTVIQLVNLNSVPKAILKFGKFLKNLKTSRELERKPGYCASLLCSKIFLGMKMTDYG